MSDVQWLMEQGIALAQSGQKDRAKACFAQLLGVDPQNEQAWLWMAQLIDNPAQKRECYQRVLRLNPSNEEAQQGLGALQSKLPRPHPAAGPALARKANSARPTRRKRKKGLTAGQVFMVAALALLLLALLGVGGWMVLELLKPIPTEVVTGPMPTPTSALAVPMGQWRFVAYNITREPKGNGWVEVEADIALVNHTSETMACFYASCLTGHNRRPKLMTAEGYKYEVKVEADDTPGIAPPGLNAPVGHWSAKVAESATGLYLYVHEPHALPFDWLNYNPGFGFDAYPVKIPLQETEVRFPTDLPPETFLSVEHAKMRQFQGMEGRNYRIKEGHTYRLKEVWVEGDRLWVTWDFSNTSGYEQRADISAALAHGTTWLGEEKMVDIQGQRWNWPGYLESKAGPGQTVEFTFGIEGYAQPSYLALAFSTYPRTKPYNAIVYVDLEP